MLSVLRELVLLSTRDQEGARCGVGADKVQVGTTEDGGAPGETGEEEALGTGQLRGLEDVVAASWKKHDLPSCLA